MLTINEDAYGFKKRLVFVEEIIRQYSPRSIMDIGCGTGEYLVVPLAKQFPHIRFYATDSDPVSINYAKNNNTLSNLTFECKVGLNIKQTFDLIIISEVLEHVEDPAGFLVSAQSLIPPSGKILLTIPNGYGPFEFSKFLENIAYFTGILYLLDLLIKTIVRMISSKNGKPDLQDATLAVSPHLNFFSMTKLKQLCENAGLKIARYKARTFLCGFGFNMLLRIKPLVKWNAEIADRLPAWSVSGWMLILEKGEERPRQTFVFKQNCFSRFRKFLNKKRYHIS